MISGGIEVINWLNSLHISNVICQRPLSIRRPIKFCPLSLFSVGRRTNYLSAPSFSEEQPLLSRFLCRKSTDKVNMYSPNHYRLTHTQMQIYGKFVFGCIMIKKSIFFLFYFFKKVVLNISKHSQKMTVVVLFYDIIQSDGLRHFPNDLLQAFQNFEKTLKAFF